MTLRALFSLDDTTDVDVFARKLVNRGWQIIATQETVSVLDEHNIPVTLIEDWINDYNDYGFPPTLHPKIEHGLTKDGDDRIDLVYCIPYGPKRGWDVGGNTLLNLAHKGARKYIDDVEDMRRFVYMRVLAHGENPYQVPCELHPTNLADPLAIANFEQVSGDVPEFTNMADLDSILTTLCLLAEALPNDPICIAAKHGNACGVGVGLNFVINALNGNARAIWGGELIMNYRIGNALANELSSDKYMLDVVAAPEYLGEAINILGKRKRRKVFCNPYLLHPSISGHPLFRYMRGGHMVQPPATYIPSNMSTDETIAWAVAYSSFHGGNEIALAKDNMLIGVGGGPSTIEAAITTVHRAHANGHDTEGATFCADAFFPFTDACEVLIKAGVACGIVPDGGKRREKIHECFDKAGVSVTYLPEQYRGFCRH